MRRVLFAAGAPLWAEYEGPLRAAFARAGLSVDLVTDAPPEAALTEATIAQAFRVATRIDRSGGSPRFSFQLDL